VHARLSLQRRQLCDWLIVASVMRYVVNPLILNGVPAYIVSPYMERTVSPRSRLEYFRCSSPRSAHASRRATWDAGGIATKVCLEGMGLSTNRHCAMLCRGYKAFANGEPCSGVEDDCEEIEQLGSRAQCLRRPVSRTEAMYKYSLERTQMCSISLGSTLFTSISVTEQPPCSRLLT